MSLRIRLTGPVQTRPWRGAPFGRELPYRPSKKARWLITNGEGQLRCTQEPHRTVRARLGMSARQYRRLRKQRKILRAA